MVSFGGGFPGIKEWVQFAGDLGDIPIAGGCTAVAAPLLYPYYPQQMVGLMGGIKGAAEYEAALAKNYPKFRDTGPSVEDLDRQLRGSRRAARRRTNFDFEPPLDDVRHGHEVPTALAPVTFLILSMITESDRGLISLPILPKPNLFSTS